MYQPHGQVRVSCISPTSVKLLRHVPTDLLTTELMNSSWFMKVVFVRFSATAAVEKGSLIRAGMLCLSRETYWSGKSPHCRLGCRAPPTGLQSAM